MPPVKPGRWKVEKRAKIHDLKLEKIAMKKIKPYGSIDCFFLNQAAIGTQADEVRARWAYRRRRFAIRKEVRRPVKENSRLKQFVANLTLNKQMLQCVLKKCLKVQQLRELILRQTAAYHDSNCRVDEILCLHCST